MILRHPALRALILTALIAGLSACASPPRYQTIYRYQPPADPAGLACLDKCTRKMETCQTQCQENYQACLKTIEPKKVDERHGEALKRYAAELDRYRLELYQYRLSLSLSWGHYPWYGHGFYHPWPEPYYFPPTPPSRPSRDEEYNRLKKEQCEADCGCQPAYDTCFLACGGTRIPEERCIANCPQ